MSNDATDVTVYIEGNLMVFTCLTPAAKDWTRDNVSLEPWQWLGNGYAVDQHYANDLADGMREGGLTVVVTNDLSARELGISWP